MDEDVFDESATEMSIIEKDWIKRKETHAKASFVAGSTAGQESTLQQGFNNGFRHGFVSNLLLAKVRGILKALMAYRASYEGHPITDDVVIDAQQLLDDLVQLEADSVADDFLSMKLNSSKQVADDDVVALSMDVDNTTIHNGDMLCQDACLSCNSVPNKNKTFLEKTMKHDGISMSMFGEKSEVLDHPNVAVGVISMFFSDDFDFGFESNRSWTLNDAHCVLLSCPEIADIIKKCRCILKRLKWTDDMIDALF